MFYSTSVGVIQSLDTSHIHKTSPPQCLALFNLLWPLNRLLVFCFCSLCCCWIILWDETVSALNKNTSSVTWQATSRRCSSSNWTQLLFRRVCSAQARRMKTKEIANKRGTEYTEICSSRSLCRLSQAICRCCSDHKSIAAKRCTIRRVRKATTLRCALFGEELWYRHMLCVTGRKTVITRRWQEHGGTSTSTARFLPSAVVMWTSDFWPQETYFTVDLDTGSRVSCIPSTWVTRWRIVHVSALANQCPCDESHVKAALLGLAAVYRRMRDTRTPSGLCALYRTLNGVKKSQEQEPFPETRSIAAPLGLKWVKLNVATPSDKHMFTFSPLSIVAVHFGNSNGLFYISGASRTLVINWSTTGSSMKVNKFNRNQDACHMVEITSQYVTTFSICYVTQGTNC